MREELLKKEIQLADDECCIVFDFGCNFPYANQDILTFSFSLGMEEISDTKLNHRYPNKNYQTITKKNGRRLSKLGYPYIMKLDEQSPMVLTLQIGIKDEFTTTLIFPFLTNLTKEKPYCGLHLDMNFDTQEFSIFTCGCTENNKACAKFWSNYEIENKLKLENYEYILLTAQQVDEENLIIVWAETIEPIPSSALHKCSESEP